MQWRGGRQSSNVEDRRMARPAGLAVGGGIGSVVLVLLYLVLGGDPRALLQEAQNNPPPFQEGNGANREGDELKEFVSVVLADTEDVWREQFREMNRTYRDPRLVLFHGQVDSACGFASAAVGPFYCPEDQKVYIDLDFYRELQNRFQAPGDFAQAYVIAHEIGHHVQRQLGIMDKVHARQQGSSEKEANNLSVRLELQADFLAGMWAHHAQKTRHILDTGDIDEALRAASAIGDDHLQLEAQGYVVPDSFTHGTSEQRVRWFRRGFETGDISKGNTFSAEKL